MCLLLQCDNCEKLQAQLDEKILQVRLKEKTINDLQGIGRKMHAQLEQQVSVAQCIRRQLYPKSSLS